MVRRLLFVLGASVSFAGVASAADIAAVGPRDWTGPYLGVVGTAGLFANEMSDTDCYTACDAPDMASWGAGIGLTAGWNAQSGHFVYGIEGDISWVGFENEIDIGDNTYLTHEASWNYLATLRARAGLTVGNVLGYVTGGVAVADTDYSSLYTSGAGFKTDQTQAGLAAGMGVEMALSDRVTLKGEYLYVGFPDVDTTYRNSSGNRNDDISVFRSDAHLLRAGLNYNFGSSAGEIYPVASTEHVDWSGLYLGIIGTGAMFASEMSDQWETTDYDTPDTARWAGGLGVTAGWNAQSGSFVYGIEGDISWTSFESEVDTARARHEASWDYLATLRARAGLAAGNVLAYVTGGIAMARTDYSSVEINDNDEFSNEETQAGLAGGMGIEVALSENLSMKGEYLYVGFPDVTAPWNNVRDAAERNEYVMTYRSDAHLIRAGLNYSFGRTAGDIAPAGDADWSGLYLGAVGTGGLFANEMSDHWCYTACDAPDMASWGGGIGVTAGWNAQNGHLVYGIEGDISWVGFENELNIEDPGNYRMEHRASWDYLATLRARAGFASGNVLGYVTGGVALARTDYSSWYVPPLDDDGFRTDQTQLGLAGGMGVEVALSESLSMKGEYLYVGFPDVDANYEFEDGRESEDVSVFRSDAHLLRVGLNYGF